MDGQRLLGWIGAASTSLAVVAWLALVLHYEYQVAWLGDYVVAEDALFLLGVAGIALTRPGRRWGAVRPVALRLALSCAALAIALIVAEASARFVFRHSMPSSSLRVYLNSLGFRGGEIGAKTPSRYRIVVMGDSFTFGNGVEERDRFSNLLQGFLGPKYEVVNVGRPGNNLPDYLQDLNRMLGLDPDFVLLQLYENDFETKDMTRHRPRSFPLLPSDLDTRFERSSLLYHLLIDRWIRFQEAVGLAERYTDYMARHLRNPDSPDARESFGMLRQFIDRTRAAGVSSGAVLFPALYGLEPKTGTYPFDYLNERVRSTYAEEQIPYLDLLPAFLTVRRPATLWVSPFDPHPNAKANHLAAIAILNRFESEWRR